MSLIATLMLAAATATVGGNTRVTSETTFYDRKEGYAFFSGKVYVEDAEYQLHADRAYVFMGSTNELKRVVALGNVAMTNGTKRAYGEKASYYRNPGMVVLYGGKEVAARVVDETAKGPQTVKGRKIKFWTNTEQVEVMEAELSAPHGGGLNDLKEGLGK